MKLYRIGAIVYRYMAQFPVNVSQLAGIFGYPLMDLILFGALFLWGGAGHTLSTRTSIFFVGIVLWQAAMRMAYTLAYNFMDELWSRNLANLAVTPLKVAEWLCASVIVGGLLSSVAALYCIFWAYLLFGQTFWFVNCWYLIPLVSMLLFGIAAGVCIIALVLIYGQRAERVAGAVMRFFLIMSGLFYPITLLPYWLQPVARALPLTHAGLLIANLVEHQRIDWALVAHAFSLNGIALVGALLFFAWALRRSLRHGLVRLSD